MDFHAKSPSSKNHHGWVILDKPEGLSSTRLGTRLKRLTGQKSIGHVGTLDPAASGVLLFALGEATKLIPYYHHTGKTYTFFLHFGEQRDTGDAEGQVIATSSGRPSLDEIQQILPKFLGNQFQKPPAYSAIRIDGQRAYHLARNQETVDLKPRPINIHSLELMSWHGEYCQLQVSCTTGTYVRSLGEDIAKALHTVAYVNHIRRIQDGKFSEIHTISLEKLDEMIHKLGVCASVKPLGFVLDDIPAITVWCDEAQRLRNGQSVQSPDQPDTPTVRIEMDGCLIGMGTVSSGVLFPKRILNI